MDDLMTGAKRIVHETACLVYFLFLFPCFCIFSVVQFHSCMPWRSTESLLTRERVTLMDLETQKRYAARITPIGILEWHSSLRMICHEDDTSKPDYKRMVARRNIYHYLRLAQQRESVCINVRRRYTGNGERVNAVSSRDRRRNMN